MKGTAERRYNFIMAGNYLAPTAPDPGEEWQDRVTAEVIASTPTPEAWSKAMGMRNIETLPATIPPEIRVPKRGVFIRDLLADMPLLREIRTRPANQTYINVESQGERWRRDRFGPRGA